MYLINNILMPVVVYSFPYFISQAWYEDGGAVQSAFTLITGDMMGSCLRVIQFPPLIRRFVLAPAAEIVPGLVWPGIDKTIAELLDELQSDEQVEPL